MPCLERIFEFLKQIRISLKFDSYPKLRLFVMALIYYEDNRDNIMSNKPSFSNPPVTVGESAMQCQLSGP